MSKHSLAALVLLAGLLPIGSAAQVARSPNADPAFGRMDFLIGEWDYDARSPTANGTYAPARFRTRAYYILDGTTLQEDFGALNPQGRFVPFGATVRTYDATTGMWRMLWYSKDLSSVTRMEGRYEDGEFHFEGRGRDARGAYLERITFYDIEADAYSWKMDRSYDDGKSWLANFFSYHAKRVE